MSEAEVVLPEEAEEVMVVEVGVAIPDLQEEEARRVVEAGKILPVVEVVVEALAERADGAQAADPATAMIEVNSI